jgi:cell filamentation protein, protein adenylyltransferase
VPDDPYIDPVSGVLRNKLRLNTAEELAAAEREITHAALILIRESPVRAAYDLPHLCAIHQRIFGDIYEWAGQIRTVAIAKGSLFCLPWYIEYSSADIFRALRSENLLRGLERRPFIDRLTFYLGEVNTVHPFREGNGRTQRAFFEQLAREAGFTLNWQHLDAARNIEASASIMHGDAEPMRKMLDPLLTDGTFARVTCRGVAMSSGAVFVQPVDGGVPSPP